MATDSDYKAVGLTVKGIKLARRLDEWLELIVDEATEDFSNDKEIKHSRDKDPWAVRDFLARCVDAVACSDRRVREHWKIQERTHGMGRPLRGRR